MQLLGQEDTNEVWNIRLIRDACLPVMLVTCYKQETSAGRDLDNINTTNHKTQSSMDPNMLSVSVSSYLSPFSH